MKKQLLTLTLLVAVAGSALGQGQVTLANNAGSLIRVNDAVAGAPAAIGSLSFQLFYGAPGTAEGSLVAVGPVVGTSTVLAGRIANTVIDIPTAVVPAGTAAAFQIWAWDSSFASYDLAFAGSALVGKSALFSGNTSGAAVPPPLPVSLAGLYPGFAVSAEIIPEPSTFALAGLGLAGLLLFRRRK